jgi:bifunctional non-homologous end joining protein LigD
MLASLVTNPPSSSLWIHEIKFDGYRIQARIDVGRVKLLTRLSWIFLPTQVWKPGS